MSTATARVRVHPLCASQVVPLGDVERTVAEQLQVLQGSDESPVIRARMSNLVIYCDSAGAHDEIAAIVPDIVAIHPCRVILLVGEPGTGPGQLTASVCVRTHRAGTTLRGSSEQITLHAGGYSVDQFPFAVRGLLIGDLPTNLWWAVPRPPTLGGPLLAELAEDAQQVIYDSFGWPEPARGMAALATWLDRIEREAGQGPWRVASDITWRRLKTWRRLLGQVLDPCTPEACPDAVTEVLVEHGPHTVMPAWSLASWLTLKLGWRVQAVKVQPGVEISWRLASDQGTRHMRIRRLGEGPRGIRRVRLAYAVGGDTGAVNVVPEGGTRLAALPEGSSAAARTITVPPQDLADLIGRQLSDRERDPVFRETMAVAQALAQSVLR